MTATDLLDDVTGHEGAQADAAAPGDPDAQAADLEVCNFVDPVTREVCGWTPPATATRPKVSLRNHQRSHVGGTDAPPAREDKPAPKGKAPALLPAVGGGERAKVYAASMGVLVLAAHLAIGAVDAVDVDIVTKGAPKLADALDKMGEKHEAVRTACDLILGGTSGGVYLELLLAAAAIGVPIAAHHGWLPVSAGERFGDLIGVVGDLTPAASPPAGAAPEANGAAASPADLVFPAGMTGPGSVPPQLVAMAKMMPREDLVASAQQFMGLTAEQAEEVVASLLSDSPGPLHPVVPVPEA